MARRVHLIAAVPAAAALAVAVAGCGGQSGPSTKGATKDAKVAARDVAAALAPTTKGVRRVTCDALDVALTYRCDVEVKGAESLVCSLRTDKRGNAAIGELVPVDGPPTCLTKTKDAAEQSRRASVVAAALAALNGGARLRTIAAQAKSSGFTLGCLLGFRTERSGSVQTDDVVVQVLAVQVDTGRTFWDVLTLPPGAKAGAAVIEKTGTNPAEQPPINPYAKCSIDAAGVATLAAGESPRDTALLPHA